MITRFALATSLTALLIAAALTGCNAADRRISKMMDALDEAGTVGTSRHLAHWLQLDLDEQDPALLPDGCGERLEQLRYEAVELKAEADALALQLDLYIDSDALSGESIESMGKRLNDRRERVMAAWAEYNRACRDAAF